MNSLSFFIGVLLPYVAIGVFVVGMAYRLRAWLAAPQPGKMTLYTNQSESTTRSVLAEALFFPSLFKGDKTLWVFAWIFHVTLAFVFIGHLRVITGLVDSLLMALGMTPEAIKTMSSVSGGAAGVVLLATAAVLLFRRVAQQRVREISNVSDYFALLLLLAIIVTGNQMRFGEHFDLEQTRVWASSLLAFSPRVPTNSAFLLHALLAQVLIIYIPFSKVLHFGGIFFTQALVKGR